jgi:hypothetical protein
MDPGAVATQRVTVVEDEDAAFTVPRLLIRSLGGPGPAGVTWELRYGGLPIASGSLGSGQESSFTEVPSIGAAMDSAGLTITARDGAGETCPIEATCLRPTRPVTRAEATARARWPQLRDQREPPAFRRRFLAETRDVDPGASPGGGPDPGSRKRVCLYRHALVLLAFRRRLLRGDERPAPGPAGPGPAGQAGLCSAGSWGRCWPPGS